jgi:hypothetical protein
MKMNRKVFGRKRSPPNFQVLTVFTGGTKENHEKPRRGRDLNPEPPEYENGVITRTKRSVTGKKTGGTGRDLLRNSLSVYGLNPNAADFINIRRSLS